MGKFILEITLDIILAVLILINCYNAGRYRAYVDTLDTLYNKKIEVIVEEDK